MKKFIILFTLFITLICISSFSWALTLDNVSYMSVDLTECNNWFNNSSYSTFDVYSALSDLGYSDSDILLYTSCTAAKSTYSNQDCINVVFARAPFYMNSQYTTLISEGRYGVVLYIGTDNSQIGYLKLGDQTTSSYIFNNTHLFANYLYSNSSLSSAFSQTQYFTNCDFFNTTFFNNAFNYSGEQPGESGGESGGEEEDNGGILNFLTNFWSNLGTNLVHIVVPNSEDWNDLQDSFEDNILDKFNITSMSFNDNLYYDWRSYNTS